MRIAVTRVAEKAGDDAKLFASFGHEAHIISPLSAELHANIVQQFVLAANDRQFDAVFFTSAYPAEVCAPLLSRDIARTCRITAVGPKTASVLHSFGIAAETLPTFYSRDYVPHLGDWIAGKSVALPRAAVPNPDLINAIEDAGGIAYEYRLYSLNPTNVVLDTADCDAVLFTSAYSFRSANIKDYTNILPLAIGDITASAMREAGVEPVVVGDGSLSGTLSALNTYQK